jgi:hypothetical protein
LEIAPGINANEWEKRKIARKWPHHHDGQAVVARRSMLRTLEFLRAVDRSD